MIKLFKVTVVLLVALFSICVLVFLFSGFITLLGTLLGPIGTGGGIFTVAGGFSMTFFRLIAIAVIVLVVGLFGLTRIGRFLK